MSHLLLLSTLQHQKVETTVWTYWCSSWTRSAHDIVLGIGWQMLWKSGKDPTPKTMSNERVSLRTPWPLYYQTPSWAFVLQRCPTSKANLGPE